jgi:Xaa-Pro aminopeptidase
MCRSRRELRHLRQWHAACTTFAGQIKAKMSDLGIEQKPLGIDLMELPMLRALEAEGIEIVDGQQAMLDAREVNTPDEIELLKVAAGMVDATYMDIAKAIRSGARESDLVAIAHEKLYAMGSERVECVNSVAGPCGAPHSTPSPTGSSSAPWMTAGRSGSSDTFTNPLTRSRFGPASWEIASRKSCRVLSEIG